MLYKKILLIDDDNDDVEIFIEAIHSLSKNIHCQAETNPIRALENLKIIETLPDLIFLDYNMPFVNGSEFLSKMREVQKLSKIPVILYCTCCAEVAQRLYMIQERVKYIVKPCSFAELQEILKNILEGNQSNESFLFQSVSSIKWQKVVSP